MESLHEEVEELTAEDFGQSLDWEEEVGPSRGPIVPILGERPAGDGAVEMDVVAQGLVPGVQDGRDAEHAA